MGTVIHTSDGGTVRLSGETEGILAGIAASLDQAHSVVDQQAQAVPKGFIPFTEAQGNLVWVNAAQITRVQKT